MVNHSPSNLHHAGILMSTKFGHSAVAWNDAKEEMRQVLIATAKKRLTISYSQLVNEVQTIHLEPDSQILAILLGEISSEEDAAGHGMLTVIVVHKTGDTQPGPGVFGLAEELGRNTSNIERCWIEELNRVLDYWSN